MQSFDWSGNIKNLGMTYILDIPSFVVQMKLGVNQAIDLINRNKPFSMQQLLMDMNIDPNWISYIADAFQANGFSTLPSISNMTSNNINIMNIPDTEKNKLRLSIIMLRYLIAINQLNK